MHYNCYIPLLTWGAHGAGKSYWVDDCVHKSTEQKCFDREKPEEALKNIVLSAN